MVKTSINAHASKGALKYGALKAVLRLRRRQCDFLHAPSSSKRKVSNEHIRGYHRYPQHLADESSKRARSYRLVCDGERKSESKTHCQTGMQQSATRQSLWQSIAYALRRFSKSRTLVSSFLALLLTSLMFAGSVLSEPFTDVLAQKTVSLRPLSRAQKNNLQIAAARLDGYVIRPGETFSFNGVVGPRSGNRGYWPAPSYLGSESPPTLGGGVCLLSSCIYQLALETRQQIIERIPHLRTVRTIPPGLDATVWYGQADLRFKNTSDKPIQLTVTYEPSEIRIALKGKATAKTNVSAQNVLKRFELRRAGNQLLVEVFRNEDGKDIFISRDLYRLR
ncbi:MAG TPA: VanW family protein [Candidatus Obscuribacterales bacterium]